MIYDVLEKKIEAAGLGVVSQTVFREAMPPGVKVGILFRSPLGGINIDPYIPGWYKPRLQVIVRHTDSELGTQMANDVIKALRVESPEFHDSPEIGRVQIAVFTPLQLPIQFPRSDGNGIEWSINFTTAFAFKPSWML